MALYNAYGEDALLKQALQQGESEYRKQRLEAALREMLGTGPTLAKQMPIPSPQKPDKKPPQKTDKKKDEDPYRKEWMPLYIEMNSLRHKLRHFKTEKERGVAAFRILELEADCMKIWGKRDYYQQTGQHMPKEQQQPITATTDLNQLELRLRNARSNVSRYKNKPDKEHLYNKALQMVKEIEAQIPRLAQKESV